MLNQMMKKRDQKKQSIKLRAATDFEMEGMHNSFRTIVKHIGGLVNPDNTQVKLQQYLRSSVWSIQLILRMEAKSWTLISLQEIKEFLAKETLEIEVWFYSVYLYFWFWSINFYITNNCFHHLEKLIKICLLKYIWWKNEKNKIINTNCKILIS